MSLDQYTSYDDIRAALGVSEEEIEDRTISLPLYEYNLTEELYKVHSSLSTQYLSVKGDVDPSALTEDQKRFLRAVYMFSTYAVAKHLTTSLPLFSPKDMSDGKSSFSRYAQNPYAPTIKMVAAEYDKWREAASSALAALLPSVTATSTPYSTGFAVASAASDPVTGA